MDRQQFCNLLLWGLKSKAKIRCGINLKKTKRCVKFVPFLFNFDSLRPGQQSFSYIGTGLPGLNQYYARINVSCSRPQHSDAGEARTHGPSVSS